MAQQLMGKRSVSLLKGKRHFCFLYEIGQEEKVIDAAIEQMNRPGTDFDWFDATLISLQVLGRVSERLRALQIIPTRF